MATMDLNSLEFEFLTAAEAMELMDTAQEKIDVYTKNKKALPPRKAVGAVEDKGASSGEMGLEKRRGARQGQGRARQGVRQRLTTARDMREGFVRSAQVEQYCTQWSLTPARRLKKFYDLAKEGMLSDVKGSVGGSFGLQRLNVKNSLLKQDLLDFVDGLIGYLSFETVTSASAVDAVLAITVDEGDFTHSLRMIEDEDYQTFKARLKERIKHAVDACTLHNQM